MTVRLSTQDKYLTTALSMRETPFIYVPAALWGLQSLASLTGWKRALDDSRGSQPWLHGRIALGALRGGQASCQQLTGDVMHGQGSENCLKGRIWDQIPATQLSGLVSKAYRCHLLWKDSPDLWHQEVLCTQEKYYTAPSSSKAVHTHQCKPCESQGHGHSSPVGPRSRWRVQCSAN